MFIRKFMKKSKIFKTVASLVVAGAGIAALVGCSKGPAEKVKVGVLVADVSGEEALAFRNYLKEYVGPNYNYDFIYSEQIQDAATAKSTAETFIGQNCKAIIDMANQNRKELAKLCDDNNVYFAIGSGVMEDADFEACKDYEHFVGQIGPDNAAEYNAGLEMGQYYKTVKEVDKVGIYGAFIPNPMHVYRFAGLLTGLGDTYSGLSGMNAVGAIFASRGDINASNIAGDVEVLYCGGYNESINTVVDGIIEQQPDAFLSVGMATTFFSTALNNAHLEYSDIDAFVAGNAELMHTGSLGYLAGKYASSLGPIFAAIKSAIDGQAIRDNGKAFSISQNYEVATTYEQFVKLQSADAGDNPIFNKTVIDSLIGKSFAEFKAAVELDRTTD